MDVNVLAIFLAALSGFLLGGLWYGPLFGKPWQKLMGLSDEAIAGSNMALIFGGSFVLSLIAAAFFAMFLGPQPDLMFAVGVGAGTGLLWVGATLGIFYLFGRKPLKLVADRRRLRDAAVHALRRGAGGDGVGVRRPSS